MGKGRGKKKKKSGITQINGGEAGQQCERGFGDRTTKNVPEKERNQKKTSDVSQGENVSARHLLPRGSPKGKRTREGKPKYNGRKKRGARAEELSTIGERGAN